MMQMAFRRHEAWLPGVVLVLVSLLRPWLESTMAGHMAIELPALFAIGWLASRALRPAVETDFSAWNLSGISCLLAASVVIAFWMLPVALDLAVLDWRVAMGKVLSLIGAGFAVGWCWRRIGPIVQAFFLFNWCSMNLTAGLLYQNAQQQLCSVYLPEEQDIAGLALMMWAIAVLAVWLIEIGTGRQGRVTPD